jgi:hypothetical protein
MIDLRAESAASLARPRLRYTLLARLLFVSMDLLTGMRTTLGKIALIELLATIPYRRWEIRQYGRLSRCYRVPSAVRRALAIMRWGRLAQDNEYWHLRLIHAKMTAEGLRRPWYLWWPIAWCVLTGYVFASYLLALFWIRRAFLLNAEFEDHAEHVYAHCVADHPEWEEQPAPADLVAEYCPGLATWADVFRRIGLDERDHRNHSFIFAGQPQQVVPYPGMPGVDPGIQSP